MGIFVYFVVESRAEGGTHRTTHVSSGGEDMFGKKENKKRSEKIINYYDMLQEGKTAWH